MVLTPEQRADPVSYLVDNWGFTEGEARRLSHDRKAYLAIPVLSAGLTTSYGVLYLDSKDEEAFTADRMAQLQAVVPYIERLLALKKELDYG